MSVAHAQADEPSGPPGGTPPTAPPPTTAPIVAPPPAAPAPTVDQGVIDDANSGGAWFMPTALTPPAGTWSISDYELLLIGASYAFTNEFSLSATTMIPIVKDQPFLGILGGKFQIVKAGSVRIALQGAITYVGGSTSSSDGTTTASGHFTAGEVGAAGTLCLDTGCHSHLSGFVGAGIADSNQSALPLILSASLVQKLNRHVKLVLEADTAAVVGDVNDVSNGLLAWYGLRFTSKNIGVDLGLVKPIISGSSSDDGVFPFGAPWISFTYRSFAGD